MQPILVTLYQPQCSNTNMDYINTGSSWPFSKDESNHITHVRRCQNWRPTTLAISNKSIREENQSCNIIPDVSRFVTKYLHYFKYKITNILLTEWDNLFLILHLFMKIIYRFQWFIFVLFPCRITHNYVAFTYFSDSDRDEKYHNIHNDWLSSSYWTMITKSLS